MRIYCSGPMTGRRDHNAPAFHEAELRLGEQGHTVINPCRISLVFGGFDEIAESFALAYAYSRNLDIEGARLARAVMDADLAAVRSCDAIYLLRGWEQSRGAKRELAEALAHGLKVMQEGAEQ